MPDKAERRILSALREGRREAYEAVIDAHYGSVYRLLLFLTDEARSGRRLDAGGLHDGMGGRRSLPGTCLDQDVAASDCPEQVH